MTVAFGLEPAFAWRFGYHGPPVCGNRRTFSAWPAIWPDGPVSLTPTKAIYLLKILTGSRGASFRLPGVLALDGLLDNCLHGASSGVPRCVGKHRAHLRGLCFPLVF